MRVLAWSHTGLWSGAEKVLLRAGLAARDRGWDVTVACPRGPFADRLRQAGLRVVSIPELKLPGGPRPLAMARLAGRWARVAPTARRLADQSDVVVVNGLLGLPPFRLAGSATPVAWLVHDSIHRREWKMLLRAVAGAVQRGLPVSEAVAGPLRGVGIDVTVVHNGTTWPVAPASDPSSPPTIGCAALLTAWKGQDVLLEAAARMRHRDVHIELLGGRFPKSPDGAYADSLERRAGEPDLRGRVHLRGFVEDVAERMRRWTIATSPSVEPEACPLGVLEAMSLGLPVVGTAHGGTPEVLGDAGVVVAPRDPQALADALDGLLDDAATRAALGEAARARVAASFAVEDRTADLLDVVADVARAAGPPGPAEG